MENLENKMWYRTVNVLRIAAYIFLAMLVYAGISDGESQGALIGLVAGILFIELCRKAIIYILAGKKQ